MTTRYFTKASFDFMRELAANNDRAWFEKNKQRYLDDIKAPALRFIEDFEPRLKKLSPHFVAGPRSLFRIYRDTRFSKDKSPYKDHVGLRFGHEKAKDVHSPGFYLHLQPGGNFVGVGIWRPDSKTLGQIREAIVENPTKWKRARDAKRFRALFELGGDALKTAPRGYDIDHPMIEDLRRKDFIGGARVRQKDIVADGFLERFAGVCAAAAPFQSWLCRAVGVTY